MSRAQFTVAISTDEEAAASKRMVLYAFSAQINLFTSFFLKQPLRNTVFNLFSLNYCRAKFNSSPAKWQHNDVKNKSCPIYNGHRDCPSVSRLVILVLG